MRELSCLFGVTHDGVSTISVPELVHRTVGHLREAMASPEAATVWVELDGMVIPEDQAPEVPGEQLNARILIDGRARGQVGVLCPPNHRFVLGEQDLVDGVAESLALAIGQREAVNRLRDSGLALRALFDASPVAFLASDIGGRVTMWTNAAERIFGWSEEEMLGEAMPFFDRRNPAHGELVAKLLQGEAFAGVEVTRAHRDGSAIDLIVSAAPVLSDGGTVSGIIAVVVDDTQRRKLESELGSAMEEALQSARVKAQFMANVSHELRTPLAVILGMNEMLLGSELDKAQHRMADAMARAAARLYDIVEDVLDFSKVAEGRLELNPGDCEVRPLVDEVRDLLAPRASAKALELVCECDPDVPTVIRADAARLRKVLIIMASNAVKFTDRGRVLVRASRSEASEAVVVRFTIIDTGIGLAGSDIWRVFRPFWQVDGSDTRTAGGTGIGLALAAELVEAMGGSIGVHSTPGRGSTFWCEIPAAGK